MKIKRLVKAAIVLMMTLCLVKATNLDKVEADDDMLQGTTEYVSKPLDLSNAFKLILECGDRDFYQGYAIDQSFLMWLDARSGDEAILDIAYEVYQGNCDANTWYANTDASIGVLWLEYCRDLGFSTYELDDVIWLDTMESQYSTANSSVIEDDSVPMLDEAVDVGSVVTIDFVGDINFADDWYTMEAAALRENGVSDCIAPNVIEELASADISVVNNEFTYGDEGVALSGKTYTFKAATENVALLSLFSADLAAVANNHVFDYGTDGLLTTLETLENAGVPYMGAGRNIEEASAIKYYSVKGRKIAFVSATEIEKFAKFTKEATSTEPGVFKTLDPVRFCSVISEAKANADYVIAYVHWGIEGKNVFGTDQRVLAEKFVNAGADAVIGGHPHRLQGVEFINDVPVAYSLGNFWFSSASLYTTIAQIQIDESGELSLSMIPCVQRELTTSILTDEADINSFYEYVADVSYSVGIDSDGRFYNTTDDVVLDKDGNEFAYRSGAGYANHSEILDLDGRAMDMVGNLK